MTRLPASRRRHLPAILIAGSLACLLAAPPAGAQDESPLPTLDPAVLECFDAAANGSPSGAPPASPDGGITPIGPEGGVLDPGVYVTQAVGPSITFAVTDCWAAAPQDAGIGMALLRVGVAAPALISFSEFEGIVFQDPCLSGTEETLDLPVTIDAIAADLAANPNLIATEPVETTVSGYPALMVDVATLQPMLCELGRVWLWAMESGGGFMLEDGEEARFFFTDVDGRVLVFAIEAYTGIDYQQFQDDAMAVIDTIIIDPTTTSATAPPLPSLPPGTSPEPGASGGPVDSAEPTSPTPSEAASPGESPAPSESPSA